MALDLLLIAEHPHALRDACLRGWWRPLLLPTADLRPLTHLTVLHPKATAIEQVAPIQALEPWPQSGWPQGGWPTPGGPEPGEPRRWLLALCTLRQLRRPIPLGRGRQLNRWRPRTLGEMRLLSIDALLLSDSLADYLERLRRRRLQLGLDPEDPKGQDPKGQDPVGQEPERQDAQGRAGLSTGRSAAGPAD
jgi:hypothetical protein